ncbi:MAG: oligosaccharide flippase family protein [Bacteroidales bacterium]|nr:oligosaccharide flippase family protein [Bacteroidales bacterium]MCF8389676.1 oligosaccharide flippase family protein [Bacteroidales bacterium]
MHYLKQLAGQTAVYGLGVVIPRLLTYVLLTPFYTRIFSPADYGIITELYAYVVFLIVILTYGLETGYFRYTKEDGSANDVYKTSLVSIIVSSLSFILLIFIFYERIASVLGYESSSKYILWMGIIVGLDALTSIPFARIRIQNKALKYSIIRIIEVLVNLFFNWFFILYCHNNYDNYDWISKVYNPDYRVGYVLLSNLLSTVVKTILLCKEIFYKEGNFQYPILKKLLIYSFPLLIAGLAGTVNEAIDRVLLKYLTQPPLIPMEQLGIYGANFKLAVLMTLFIQMFRYAAEPFFFSKMNDSNARIIYADVMKYFIFAAMGIFLLVVLYLDIFMLFIGADFREAIAIVPIILLANVFMGIFYNLSVWYKLTNLTKFGAYLVFSGAAITIIINIVFIPKWGYMASAWGHFFAYLTMIILSYLFGRKYYIINYDLKRISLYIFTSLIIFILFKNISITNEFILYGLKTLSLFLYFILFVFLERKLKYSKNES